MNSFNNITKIKYNSEKSELLQLIEYVIFEDDNNVKYLVLKIKNTITQEAYSLNYELSQKDENGNVIKTSNILYDGFVVKGGDEFVPQAKYQLEDATKTIDVKLIEATFEKMEFKNDTCYNLDISDIKDKKELKKIKKAKKKKVNPSKARKNNFKIKEIKSLHPTATLSLATLLGLATLAFVVVGSFITKRSTSFYVKNDFMYSYISQDAIEIRGYVGEAVNVVVPEEIGGLRVAKIGYMTFSDDSKIKKVTIESKETEIAMSAFYNCKNLTEVNGDGEYYVDQAAFAECKSLETIKLPNATLNYGALAHVNNLKNLEFKTTGTSKFLELFGETLPTSLIKVTTHQDYLNEDFYTDIDHCIYVYNFSKYGNDALGICG